MKGCEVRVLKGWEVGEIGGNYAQSLIFHRRKRGLKGGSQEKQAW